MSWSKEKATKYKNDFIAQTYDRVNLTLPKGYKEQVKTYAEANGESLNGYINRLIAEDMGDKLTRPEQEQGE